MMQKRYLAHVILQVLAVTTLSCSHDNVVIEDISRERIFVPSMQTGAQPYVTQGIMVMESNNWFIGGNGGVKAYIGDAQVVYLQDDINTSVESDNDLSDEAKNPVNPFHSDVSALETSPLRATNTSPSSISEKTPYFVEPLVLRNPGYTENSSGIRSAPRVIPETDDVVRTPSNHNLQVEPVNMMIAVNDVPAGKSVPSITSEITTVNFSLGVTQIKDWDINVVKDAIDVFAKSHQITKVDVLGYTDSTGNEGLNQKIAELRTKSVVAAIVPLLPQGIELTFRGRGSCCYVNSNDTRIGRSKNRRVDIVLQGLQTRNDNRVAKL